MYASTKCKRGTGVLEENGGEGRVERKQRKGHGKREAAELYS